MKPLMEEELQQVTGGLGVTNMVQNGEKNDDPLDASHRLTWCSKCKKLVKYSEFTGGRYVCDNCGEFVQA